MTTAEERRRTGERLREADEVLAALAKALGAAGVRLPSLGIDQASCAREVPRPLIELGRCDVATARTLAAALEAPR
ncbi:hypothetical protein [Streptomyces sp. NPDC002851]